MISKASFILALLLFSASPALWAAEIKPLFAPDGSSVAYSIAREDNQLVFLVDGDKAVSGDQLQLDTGEVFQFDEILGSGKHTIVLKTMGGSAVRLPMNLEPETLEIHQDYMESYRVLNNHIPSRYLAHPARVPFQSRLAYRMELLPISITLDEFIRSPRTRRGSVAYNELLQFLQAMTVFQSADDFYDFQIGHVEGRGWILFDYGRHWKYSFHQKGSHVSPLKYVVPHLFDFENSYNLKVVNWIRQDLKAKERENSSFSSFLKACRTLLGR